MEVHRVRQLTDDYTAGIGRVGFQIQGPNLNCCTVDFQFLTRELGWWVTLVT